MGIVFSGLLSLAGMIIAAMAVFGAVTVGVPEGIIARGEAGSTLVTQRNSAYSLVSAVVSSSAEYSDITVVAENTGATTESRLGSMDVIVDYEAAGGAQEASRLTYVTGSPADDQWTVTTLAPDEMDPGMWDPGETATLTLRVAPKIQPGTTFTVVVVSSGGVTARGSFGA